MKEKGIHELYAEDPDKADYLLWGRITDKKTRRGFLKKAGLTTLGLALGADIVFANKMPGGLIPAFFANSNEPFQLEGKHSEMTVLNDRPWNIEAPPHLLDDNVTPASRLFVRNNGIPPSRTVDADDWTFELAGESCIDAKTLSVADLKANFEHHTLQLQIECGGNGRSEFYPPARGNQWTQSQRRRNMWPRLTSATSGRRRIHRRTSSVKVCRPSSRRSRSVR